MNENYNFVTSSEVETWLREPQPPVIEALEITDAKKSFLDFVRNDNKKMEVRADTYLWAIRMYKSRSLASEAIKGGKVKLNGDNFKPSHLVQIGERYTINIGGNKKIIEVKSLLDKRQSFEIAQQHYTDQSPPPEKHDYLPTSFFKVNIRRDKGTGRPTKKDRRDLDDFNR